MFNFEGENKVSNLKAPSETYIDLFSTTSSSSVYPLLGVAEVSEKNGAHETTNSPEKI